MLVVVKADRCSKPEDEEKVLYVPIYGPQKFTISTDNITFMLQAILREDLIRVFSNCSSFRQTLKTPLEVGLGEAGWLMANG
jgi:hypothetical protein